MDNENSSTNSESTFEFVEKKIDQSSSDDKSYKDGSSLLSTVAPPSALPSFVPFSESSAIPSSTSSSQTFHPIKFNPVIPADKGSTSKTIISNGAPSTEVSDASKENENLKGASGLFDWVKDAGDMSWVMKVASKAKTSVGSMITTLDPQMKDYLSPTSADLEIVVASDKEVKISPIREAFQSIFSRCNIRGLGAEAKTVAAQPVGYEAANKAAWDRIERVRSLYSSGPIIAIENFIVEITPDRWFDLGLIILSDVEKSLSLEMYTQMTPVPSYVVTLAKDDTPDDYPLKATGFAITIGNLMASNLHVHNSEWHHALTGVSRRDMILLAAKSLANIYKNSIQ